MMKKLLLLLIITELFSCVTAQNAFKYPVSVPSLVLRGSVSGTLTIQATSEAGSNTLTAPAETGTVATRTNVSTQIADSLNAARADGINAVALADSTGYLEGNYITRYGAEEIGSRGWASGGLLKALQSIGSTKKGLNLIESYSEAAHELADARAYYVAMYVPEATTITGVTFYINTPQGDFTADEFNGMALYVKSGNNLSRVAITANDPDQFKAVAYSVVNFPFTGAYAAEAGVYWVGILYNASAVVANPKLYTTAQLGSTFSGNVAGTAKIVGYIAAQTTLPESQAFSGLTASSYNLTLQLY